MPETEELYVVVFYKTNGTKIVELLLRKSQRTKMIYLGVDFFRHFRCKNDVFIAALEIILTAEIGMLVKDHLIHIEFVEVCVKQRHNNRFEFHSIISLHLIFSIID